MTLLVVLSQTVVSPLVAGVRSPAHRIRTTLLHPASGALSADEHVRVRLSGREPSGQEFSAEERSPVFGDVLIEHGEGARKVAQLAASHPGALVVAVHHGLHCWIWLGPGGHVVELEARGPGQPEKVWETAASLAHSCLVAGLPAALLGSAAVRLIWAQTPDSPPSNCRSRCRVDSASSDCDRPTEE